MPGYPDWQRYPTRVGDNLLGGNDNTLPPGTKTYGPFALAAFAGLSLTVLPYAGYGTVRVDWWETSSMLNSVKYDQWTVNGNTDLIVTMPAFSPWATVKIDVTSAVDMSYVGSARGMAAAGPTFSFPVTDGGVRKTDITLAALATAIYPVPFIRCGQAYVSVNPYDTTAKLFFSLVSVNPDGTLDQVITRFGSPAGLYNDMLVVPALALGLYAANNDTAASHTFDATLEFGP